MLDVLNNNPGLIAIVSVVFGLIGVVLGWGLNTITDSIKYKRQKRDEEEREQRERFKHKGEFFASDGGNIPTEKFYNLQNVDVLFCSYKASLNKNGEVVIKYPKEIRNSKSLKRHTIFFENIGDSDINELQIAVESPKHHALIYKELVDDFAEQGLISYGVLLDRKIRKGEIVSLTIYYCEEDSIVPLFSASLLLFYRDALGNICEQPVFADQDKIYEPTLIT